MPKPQAGLQLQKALLGEAVYTELWPNRGHMIGANKILYLHTGLYHDWYKLEGTAVIGADILPSSLMAILSRLLNSLCQHM
jgi:hypothetical protein